MHDPQMAACFGLAAGGLFADGYAATGDADRLANSLGLTEDRAGNAVVRETALAEPFESGSVPLAAVAVGLMDSLAVRERSAGARFLAELLGTAGWDRDDVHRQHLAAARPGRAGIVTPEGGSSLRARRRAGPRPAPPQ
ncbi:hypothetical protein [Arthrobacter mobilis]|uniref:Uncharacterized protein n=1 Tax=Arthrobacter mobilis TaxID=2724944 RepID=A0A7X6K815_9MICC|nr:hypothetical protein [Arthrobacter mobilis]NKX56831.1 hypothetical protein [Arthrobacter mobilis]